MSKSRPNSNKSKNTRLNKNQNLPQIANFEGENNQLNISENNQNINDALDYEKELYEQINQNPSHNSIQENSSSFSKFTNFLSKNVALAIVVTGILVFLVGVLFLEAFANKEYKPSELFNRSSKSSSLSKTESSSNSNFSSSSSSSSSTQNSNSQSSNSSTSQKPQEIDTGKNWTGKITLQPKDKTWIKNENIIPYGNDEKGNPMICGVYGAITFYRENVTGSMKIVNYNLDSSKSNSWQTNQLENFKAVEKFINGDNNYPSYQPAQSEYITENKIYQAFINGCGGYGTSYLYDLDNNITLSNTEKTRVVATVDGQGLIGNLVANIFAKKGDNLIHINGYVGGFSYVYDKCNPEAEKYIQGGDYTVYSQKLNECANNEYSKPENKQKANDLARDLVKKFELDNITTDYPDNTTPAPQSPIKNPKTYTNQYFPDFKLVYPEDWKFETSTTPSTYENLLNRTVTLRKNSIILQFYLNPKTPAQCGGGGGDESKLKIETLPNGVKKRIYDNSNIGYGLNGADICDYLEIKTNISTSYSISYKKQYPQETQVVYQTTISLTQNIGANNPLISEIDQIISQSSFR